MQLEQLEIGGFLHFDRPAALDLREVPAGLVAVVGANGQGKTRLLDAALGGLYGAGVANRAFPSREGTLAAYATSRDAYIDTTWSVEGMGLYRARVNVDGTRRESDAVLEQLTGLDGALAVPLNDGKVSTFREAVARVFPPRRQVLASVFAAQGKEGSFVTLDQKGRMELFYELLADLKAMEGMAGTARECAALAERALAAHRAQLEEARRQASPERAQQLRARVHELGMAADSARRGHEAAERRLAEAEASRDALAEAAQAYALARQQASTLVVAVAGLQKDLQQLDASVQAAGLERERTEAQAVRTHADTVAAAHRREFQAEQRHADLAKRREVEVAALRALLEKREEVQAAAAEEKDCEARLAEARTKLQADAASLEEAREQLRAAERALDAVVQAERQLDRDRALAAGIAEAPFGEQCAPCGFMATAAQAQARLAGLEAQAARRPDLERSLAACDLRVRGFGAVHTGTSETVAELEARHAAVRRQAAGLPQVLHAAAAIERAQQEVVESEAALERAQEEAAVDREAAGLVLAEAKRQAAAHEAQRQAEAAARREDLQRRIGEAAAELRVAREMETRHQSAGTGMDAVRAEIAGAQAASVRHASHLAQAEAELAARREELDRLEALLERAVQLSGRMGSMEDELLVWQLLARALGRDGLPKLEVDAAGPAISDLTNDLLAVGYGTRFTVDVVTQVERADKKGLKEEFDILVFDNLHGGERRSIADLSGGEKVVVEEALRGAIALFHNARTSRPIRTCWRDETTGALDAENVPKYVAMLRRIQEIGGFRHVLFVTHNAEAAALADAQVRVRGGQARVALPPFQGEAA